MLMTPGPREMLHLGPDLSYTTDLIEHLMETSTSMLYQGSYRDAGMSHYRFGDESIDLLHRGEQEAEGQDQLS